MIGIIVTNDKDKSGMTYASASTNISIRHNVVITTGTAPKEVEKSTSFVTSLKAEFGDDL
jgi:hypothetical protein